MNPYNRFVIVVVSSHKGCFVARVWADRCLDEIAAMAAMLGKGIHITAGPSDYSWTFHAPPKGRK